MARQAIFVLGSPLVPERLAQDAVLLGGEVDHAVGDHDVDGAEVEHDLSRRKLGQRGGVATSEGGLQGSRRAEGWQAPVYQQPRHDSLGQLDPPADRIDYQHRARARCQRPPTRNAMIDFSLTDEQLAIQELARRFAREEIRPVAAEYDEREEMPWPVLAKAA